MPTKKKAQAKKVAAKVVKPEVKTPKMIDHIVTVEDLEMNPDLVEQGVTVGETIQIPEDAIVSEEEAKEILGEDAPVTSDEETEEEEESEENDSEQVSVYKENGEFVRTYSKEVHGKVFKASAKEFASKHEGYFIK